MAKMNWPHVVACMGDRESVCMFVCMRHARARWYYYERHDDVALMVFGALRDLDKFSSLLPK